MKKCYLIIAAALAAVGCAKEIAPEATEPVSYSVNVLHATVESGATKAAVGVDGAFTWTAMDLISVFDDSSIDTYKAATGGSSATDFSPVSGSGLATPLYAVYPSTAASKFTSIKLSTDPQTISISYPSSYNITDGSYAKMPMLAKVDGDNVSLKHLGGLLRIDLGTVAAGVKSFVATFPGYKVNGTFSGVDLSAATPSIPAAATSSSSSQKITFTYDSALAADTDVVLYVPLPHGTYENSVTVDMLDAAGVKVGYYAPGREFTVSRAGMKKISKLQVEEIVKVASDATSVVVPAKENGVAIDFSEVTGGQDIALSYGGSKPEKVFITGKASTNVGTVSGDLSSSTVDMLAGTYAGTSLKTAASTLIIEKGVTVGKVNVEQGNVVVDGIVTEITVPAGATSDGTNAVEIQIAEDKAVTVTTEAAVNVVAERGATVSVITDDAAIVSTTGSDEDATINIVTDKLSALKKVLSEGGSFSLSEKIVADEPLVVAAGKEVVLDLGVFTLSGEINGKLITNNGKLTINSANNAGGVYNTDVTAQGHDAIFNAAGGILIINGGCYGDNDSDKTNANVSSRGGAVRNFGTATLNGGTYSACDNYTGTGNGFAYAIINGGEGADADCAMTIRGVTTYGKNNGSIAVNTGTVTISSGTFTISGDKSYYNLYADEGSIIVKGGTFTKENDTKAQIYVDSETGSVTISAGTFNASSAAAVAGKTENVKISGGRFSYDPTECLADGYRVKPETTYTVEKYIVNENVTAAKDIGTSLNTSGTYTLGADISGSRFTSGIASSADITVNLNSHSISTNGGSFANFLLRGSTKLTINGEGTVTNTSGKSPVVWSASANNVTTINGGTFNASGHSECIYSEYGTIYITGGVFKSSGATDHRYLLNCKDANYKSGTAKIIVTGGTFFDFNPADCLAEGAGTNFVAEGYHVETSTDGDSTVYTVVAD